MIAVCVCRKITVPALHHTLSLFDSTTGGRRAGLNYVCRIQSLHTHTHTRAQ